jgi:microcystin-dependent protein
MSLKYHGVTVPEGTDLADAPKAFRDLVNAGNAVPMFTTTAERDTWASPPDGALCVVQRQSGVTGNRVQQFTTGVGWKDYDATPVGIVSMFAGAVAPSGYLLCDGSAVPADPAYDPLRNLVGANVPDLRNRFVLGWGTKAVKATGGAETVTLTTAQMPNHAHGGNTGQAGGHAHTGSTGQASINHDHGQAIVAGNGATPGLRWDYVGEGASGNRLPQGVNTDARDVPHSHPVTVDPVGNHGHTIPAEGGGQAHDNMPPFYVLAFAIKAV